MRNRADARYAAVIAGTSALIALVFWISLTSGEFDLSVKDILRTLLRIDPVAEYDLVVFDFRLPRIVIAALVGFGLGAAGCVVQGIARNPLADPGILGIHAGAGAAVVAFLFFAQGSTSGIGWLSVMTMPVFGWVGGMGAAALIYAFARIDGKLDPQRLLLVGIAFGSGIGAATLYLSLKMNPRDFEAAAVWLAGSIWGANWTFAAAMLPWLVLLVPVVWKKSKLIDLFQLEEASVKALGVATEREKVVLLACAVGIVSACVSVSGTIGFVGLIAPHMAKRLVGLRHARIIPASGLIGTTLVLAGDWIGATAFAPMELPVGIVVSIIGVPYFVYLLFRGRA